jgi:hypothetical protein
MTIAVSQKLQVHVSAISTAEVRPDLGGITAAKFLPP